jgi:hypothetical protein
VYDTHQVHPTHSELDTASLETPPGSHHLVIPSLHETMKNILYVLDYLESNGLLHNFHLKGITTHKFKH